MDADPRSEGLCDRDPPRPPCVPVSPRPRDKVPKGRGAPMSRPVHPPGAPGGIPWSEVLLKQIHSVQKGPPEGIPRSEVLLRQIHSVQKARQAMLQELAEAQGRSEELRQHLEQLEQREEELDRLWQQAQESLRRARLHGKEVEAEGQRRRGICLEQQQDLAGVEQQQEQLREQLWHLRREHRWEFWQQLDAIMEEHKRLQDVHAPAHLEAELMRLEKMREKLLSGERHLMEAEEQLGPEALLVKQLVEQEQEAVQQRLEAELGRRELSLGRRDRLAEELQHLLEAPPE